MKEHELFSRKRHALDQAFWGSAWRWPRGNSAHVFAGHALSEIGKAMFGSEWTGEELKAYSFLPSPEWEQAEWARQDRQQERVAAIKLPPPSLADYPSSSSRSVNQTPSSAGEVVAPDTSARDESRSKKLDELRRLHETNMPMLNRLTRVVDWFVARAADEELVTYLRLVDTKIDDGVLHFAPPNVWNVEMPMLSRFHSGHFMARLPQVARSNQAHPVYAFVTRESLDRCKLALAHASESVPVTELGNYSPYLRFAVTLAQRWNADKRWSPPKHPMLVHDIQKAWEEAYGTPLKPTPADYIARILKFPD